MSLVIPEVFADAVNQSMDVSLRVGRLATDYTDMVDEITTCGDTVHFPTIDRIADADTVTKGTALVPDEVNMTDAKAEIKQVGKSVRIYDKDNIQVKGKLKDRLAEQLGQSMAKAVDIDLVNSIKNEAVYKADAMGGLTLTDIDAAFEVFGDQIDNDDFSGILINSQLRRDIVRMPEFTSIELTYAKNGNGMVKDGVIGYWSGSIPVMLSDNGTSYDGKLLFAIVKKDALGVVWQKQATVEEEREAKLLATDLVANELYATKLVNTDGVSIVEVYRKGETPDDEANTDTTDGADETH